MAGSTALNNQTYRERDFFISLSRLCEYFDIPVEPNDHPYPYNIVWELNRIKMSLDALDRGYCNMEVMETNTSAACIVMNQVFDSALYYIPLKPVWQLRKTDKPTYLLMLSVYAYLNQIAGIAAYAGHNAHGYIAYQYDMLNDYYRHELDEAELDEYYGEEKLALLDEASQHGATFFKSLRQPRHLKSFASRLEQYQPETEKQTELHRIATGIYNLYQAFPERTINDSIVQKKDEEDEDEDREDVITVDRWTSFVWSHDHVLDEIIENLNQCEFANATSTDEPESFIAFDRPNPVGTHNLTFEFTLYDLLDDLIYTLNKPANGSQENNP